MNDGLSNAQIKCSFYLYSGLNSREFAGISNFIGSSFFEGVARPHSYTRTTRHGDVAPPVAPRDARAPGDTSGTSLPHLASTRARVIRSASARMRSRCHILF